MTSQDDKEGPLGLLAGFPFLSGAAGVILYFVALYKYPPVDEAATMAMSIIGGLILSGLYVGLAAFLMRRDPAMKVRVGIIAVFSLIGITLLGVGGLPMVNGALDQSGPVVRTVNVKGVSIIKSGRRYGGGGGNTAQAYYAIVESWVPGRRQEQFQVTPYDGQRIDKGYVKTMEVSIRNGLLGMPWLDKVNAIDRRGAGR